MRGLGDARWQSLTPGWVLGGGFALALSLALPACSRNESDHADSNGTRSNPLLSVTPGEMAECSPGLGVAEVSWDASQLGVSRIRVEVGQLGGQQTRTFFVGDSKSSSTTEQWVRIGTVFMLLDDETGKFLDSYEVKAIPCL